MRSRNKSTRIWRMAVWVYELGTSMKMGECKYLRMKMAEHLPCAPGSRGCSCAQPGTRAAQTASEAAGTSSWGSPAHDSDQ